MRRLIITLRSDLCAGNGESQGNRVDTDIWTDRFGLPVIPARRIKGCLRDSANFLVQNGLFAEDVTRRLFGTKEYPAALTVGDALLPEYMGMLSELKRMKHEGNAEEAAAAPNSVKEVYTHLNGQTGLENGIAAANTLRFTRVLNSWDPLKPGERLTFVAWVGIEQDEPELWDALESCCKATRHIGTHRNRGLGQVMIRIQQESASAFPAVITPPKPQESEIMLEYRLALDANIVLQTGPEKLDTIPGRTVIGLMAGEWLKTHEADAVFDDLFLNGRTRWSELTPVIGGIRSEPAPMYLVWSRNLNAYVNIYDVKGKQIGKTRPAVGLFASENEGSLRIADVQTDYVYHHRHEHGQAEAQLYQHESLESGMIYAGLVRFSAGRWDEITALLAEGQFRIGHSRSAQYAACHLTDIRVVPVSSGTVTVPAGEPVFALLTSDLVLCKNGLYTADSGDVRKAIADVLGLNPDDGSDDRCHYHTVGGYHAVWGLRKPQITVVSGGSVYGFLSGGNPLPREITVGEFPQEGMGCVRILRREELKSAAFTGRIDRSPEESGSSCGALRTALLLHAAQEAVKKSADTVFRTYRAVWATQENNGLMGRLRAESQRCTSPAEFLCRIENIRDSRKRETAKQVFSALYGEGSEMDIVQGMLSSDPELLSRIREDGAAVKRLLSGWRMPLMHLLHTIYFSKAGDGQ